MTLTPVDTAINSNTTLPASVNTFTDTSYTIKQINTSNTTDSVANMNHPNSNVYGYGNYYSWPVAVNNTTLQTVVNRDVATSICPKGWRLPTNRTYPQRANSDTYKLGVAIFGRNPDEVTNNSYAMYINDASNLFRSYPNNFVYAGTIRENGFTYRGASGNGYFHSSTSGNGGTPYYYTLQVSFSYLKVCTTGCADYTNRGHVVRCIAQ